MPSSLRSEDQLAGEHESERYIVETFVVVCGNNGKYDFRTKALGEAFDIVIALAEGLKDHLEFSFVIGPLTWRGTGAGTKQVTDCLKMAECILNWQPLT